MPVIGFLSMESPGQFMHIVNAFRRGLSGAGYAEHRNVGIDYSWAEGRPDRLPALAAELVSRQVTVIAATGGPQSDPASPRDRRAVQPEQSHGRAPDERGSGRS